MTLDMNSCLLHGMEKFEAVKEEVGFVMKNSDIGGYGREVLRADLDLGSESTDCSFDFRGSSSLYVSTS